MNLDFFLRLNLSEFLSQLKCTDFDLYYSCDISYQILINLIFAKDGLYYLSKLLPLEVYCKNSSSNNISTLSNNVYNLDFYHKIYLLENTEFDKLIGIKSLKNLGNFTRKIINQHPRNVVANFHNKFVLKCFGGGNDENFKCISSSYEQYNNERKVISILKKYNIVPEILSYDDEKLLIFYSYCGEPLKFNEINTDIRNKLMNIINIFEANKINHNDLTKKGRSSMSAKKKDCFSNILIKDGEIRVIDFEFTKVNSIGPKKIQKRIATFNDRDILKY